MDPTEIGLFQLADRRLAWLDQRQALLAQNIANADTPGFKGRDLQPFSAVLSGLEPGLARTSAGHMAPPAGSHALSRQRPRETALDGNAVSVDEQLTRVADTGAAQELAVNLYHKYLGLFHTALGKTG